MLELILASLLVASSVVVHEAGHWMLLRRFGVRIVSVGLGLGPDLARIGRLRVGMLPIGASVTPDARQFEALSPGQRLWVALAGPWLSAMYAVALLMSALALPEDLPAHRALALLSNLNWLLAGLNLLPIPPLDGFRALEYWLELTGRPLSLRLRNYAYRLGNGLVFGFGFAAVGMVLAREYL